MKYLNKDEGALEYIFEIFMNPSKERVSSKFKKLNQDLAGYSLKPKYSLLMTKINKNDTQYEDLSLAYIRSLRIYQLMIHPENLALFEHLNKDFIKIYIEKLTKLLTPQSKEAEAIDTN